MKSQNSLRSSKIFNSTKIREYQKNLTLEIKYCSLLLVSYASFGIRDDSSIDQNIFYDDKSYIPHHYAPEVILDVFLLPPTQSDQLISILVRENA